MTWDNYIEEELIGKGSYGKVYRVKSKSDSEVLVMKKIALTGTPAAETDASVREANLLALLRHPHVVPYREFFKHKDGELCLVMAYCEGGDMFKYIKGLKRNETLVDEETAWTWLVQLLLALSYCHSKKILHRDVKTQNIFISGGKVLLGDFGLAKQLQRTLEMARTPIGTPYYMAPEIYEEQPYSYKSDLWALGCVMYELLATKPAFAADNLSRVVMRVIRGTYDALPETYSPELREVVGSMLNKVVKNRPEANELLQHPSVVPRVQRYLDELSAAGPNGWNTWRMKLPPTVLAQMAEVIEHARTRQSSSGTAPIPVARVGGGGTGVSGAAVYVAGGGEKRPLHLPQSIEDLMTSSELIEGFSLQSLLLDDVVKGGVGKGGGVNPLLAASLHPADIKALKLQHQQKASPAVADGASKYSELRVISHQLNVISHVPGNSSGGEDEYSDDEHFVPEDGHMNWTRVRETPTKRPAANATMARRDIKGGDGTEWLSTGLPAAGLGFGGSGKGFAVALDNDKGLSAGLPAAGLGFGGSGKGFATPVSKTGTPTVASRSTPTSTPPKKQHSTPSRATTSSSPATPSPSSRPPPLSYSDSEPGRTGYLPPLGQNSYKEMGSGRLDSPHASYEFPISPNARPPPKEMMTFSIGQISLHETLTNRFTYLRKELVEQIGERVLSAATALIKALQTKNSQQEGEGIGDAGLRLALQGTVPPAYLELAPLVDELVFLERRMEAEK